MKTKEIQGLRLTKEMATLFRRYGAKLRDSQTPVTHALYETTVEVRPVEFAIFETALKANYVGWAMSDANWVLSPAGGWMAQLMENNRIDVPDFSEEFWQDRIADQCNAHYYKCVKWLRKAGLYYDLLD